MKEKKIFKSFMSNLRTCRHMCSTDNGMYTRRCMHVQITFVCTYTYAIKILGVSVWGQLHWSLFESVCQCSHCSVCG